MIHRRKRALRCQLNKAHAPEGPKKGIVFDAESTNFPLSERGETVIDFRVVAGSDNHRFPTHCRHREFKVFERKLL